MEFDICFCLVEIGTVAQDLSPLVESTFVENLVILSYALRNILFNLVPSKIMQNYFIKVGIKL